MFRFSLRLWWKHVLPELPLDSFGGSLEIGSAKLGMLFELTSLFLKSVCQRDKSDTNSDTCSAAHEFLNDEVITFATAKNMRVLCRLRGNLPLHNRRITLVPASQPVWYMSFAVNSDPQTLFKDI